MTVENYERFPAKRNSLLMLRKLGVEFSCILDVGVQTKTQELIDVFPDLKHYLFEPVGQYIPAIKRSYENLDYEIINAAVSNRDGSGRLELKSIGSGQGVTHSNVTEGVSSVNPLNVSSDKKYVDIDLTCLSTFISGRNLPDKILLKIDVDGHELAILEGLKGCERKIHVLIVEAGVYNFLDRADLCRSMGFVLWDICDLCYYKGCLAQMDLVFVSRELALEAPLQPLSAGGPFDFSAWQAFPKRIG